MESNMKNRFANQQLSESEPRKKMRRSVDETNVRVDSRVPTEDIQESMASLREKLDLLKSMVDSNEGLMLPNSKSKKEPVFVDANVLSAVFVIALAAILGVTAYAFQGLYVAVQKKWASK